jgi:hypothetical protein
VGGSLVDSCKKHYNYVTIYIEKTVGAIALKALFVHGKVKIKGFSHEPL